MLPLQTHQLALLPIATAAPLTSIIDPFTKDVLSQLFVTTATFQLRRNLKKALKYSSNVSAASAVRTHSQSAFRQAKQIPRTPPQPRSTHFGISPCCGDQENKFRSSSLRDVLITGQTTRFLKRFGVQTECMLRRVVWRSLFSVLRQQDSFVTALSLSLLLLLALSMAFAFLPYAAHPANAHANGSTSLNSPSPCDLWLRFTPPTPWTGSFQV